MGYARKGGHANVGTQKGNWGQPMYKDEGAGVAGMGMLHKHCSGTKGMQRRGAV